MIQSKLNTKSEWISHQLVEHISEAGLSEFSLPSAKLWEPHINQYISLIDENLNNPFVAKKGDFFSTSVKDYITPQVNKHRFNGTPFAIFSTIIKLQKKVFYEAVYDSNCEEINFKKILTSINSIFDQVDTVIGHYWIECNCNCSEHINLLEKRNIINVKKKNVYITIFEGIPYPLVILNESLGLKNMNLSAEDYLSDLNLEAKYFITVDEINQNCKLKDLDFEKLLGYDFVLFKQSNDLTMEISVTLDDFEMNGTITKMFDITQKIDGYLFMINDGRNK